MAQPASLTFGGPRHTSRRRVANYFWLCATGLCAALLVIPLVAVLVYLFSRGLRALDLNFFTQLPRPVGEPGGGIGNAIVGSAMITLGAALGAVPVGILAAVYLHEFARGTRLGSVIRFTCDMLNATPSIILGIFAYSLVVIPMGRFSALAGAFALFVMMLPIVVRGSEEILRTIPDNLREASLALGASRWQTIRRTVLPAALGGITTAVFLALARVGGETAPLLFTALGNDYWSFRPDEPINTLPVQIYKYATSPYEDWHRQAWAAALLLVITISVLNAAARLVAMRRR